MTPSLCTTCGKPTEKQRIRFAISITCLKCQKLKKKTRYQNYKLRKVNGVV